MSRLCCDKQGTDKSAWKEQEDQKLVDHVPLDEEGCWSSLPDSLGLQWRGKRCWLRWNNYSTPRVDFSEEEDDLIIKMHALLGNRWPLIAGRLPGRTENEVENHWDSYLRPKLARMGIDPNNRRLIRGLPPPCTHSISKATLTEDVRRRRKTKLDDRGLNSYAESGFNADGSSALSMDEVNLELIIQTPSQLHADRSMAATLKPSSSAEESCSNFTAPEKTRMKSTRVWGETLSVPHSSKSVLNCNK